VRSLARLVESLAASRTDHANSEIVRGPFCGGQALVDYSNQRLLDRRSVPIRPHLERFPQRSHADAVQTLELREACPASVWHISSSFPRLVVTWIRRAVGGKSRVKLAKQHFWSRLTSPQEAAAHSSHTAYSRKHAFIRCLGINDCSAVSRPEGVLDYNRHYINDLPTTSPHGSDSNTLRELLELYRFERRAWHSSATPREDVSILESFVRSFAEWIDRSWPTRTRRSWPTALRR